MRNPDSIKKLEARTTIFSKSENLFSCTLRLPLAKQDIIAFPEHLRVNWCQSYSYCWQVGIYITFFLIVLVCWFFVVFFFFFLFDFFLFFFFLFWLFFFFLYLFLFFLSSFFLLLLYLILCSFGQCTYDISFCFEPVFLRLFV